MLPSFKDSSAEAGLSTLDGAVLGVVLGVRSPFCNGRYESGLYTPVTNLGGTPVWKSMIWLSSLAPLLMTASRGGRGVVVVDAAAGADAAGTGAIAGVNESDDKGREEVRLSRNRNRLYASR